jgi:hypothetical protein
MPRLTVFATVRVEMGEQLADVLHDFVPGHHAARHDLHVHALRRGRGLARRRTLGDTRRRRGLRDSRCNGNGKRGRGCADQELVHQLWPSSRLRKG